ncbi:uncharacterized protein SCHCODRAFT_02685144 [Schizophyllum commune H4-8]|uniref:BTB domain-containing protein n=1 Tax=Schizophyllum commune (strain H4-8 / FGSC 9210) TaxID=578458 RepID=D8PYP7_SCHCM|nr:uncharacterized protein SCHCODRAFT_02685144 [Schizophyllum commune H4-8]KAI5896063.1 hypothetical protein SCHCODRAFT_02685144 [Schizophyllum commune H4-8]
MASTPRSGKRARTDDADAQSPYGASQTTRHSTHWYRDGSIVLHVENVLFRVHQTVLETHSEVFRDMSAVSQIGGEQTLDGCHIVRLHGDSSEDWACLLDSLYNALLFFNNLVKKALQDKLHPVAAVLRLSTKYRIPTHREESIKILSKHFPSSNAYTPVSLVDLATPELAYDVIKVARESNAPTLLPFAFLLICAKSPDEVASSGTLASEDKIALLKGIIEFERMRRAYIYEHVENFVHSGCEKACVLNRDYEPWYSGLTDNAADWVKKGSWKAMIDASDLGHYICGECYDMVLSEVVIGEQAIWEALPRIFSVGATWMELRRVQNYDT